MTTIKRDDRYKKNSKQKRFTTKRTTVRFLSLFFVLLLGAGMFSACNFDSATSQDETSSSAHEHTYSDEWSMNETEHWHTATCEHTNEKKNLEQHTYENGVCKCGASIIGTYSTDHVVVTEISAQNKQTFNLGDKYFYIDELPKNLIVISIKNDGTLYISAEGNQYTATYTGYGNNLYAEFSEPISLFGNANSELISVVDGIIENNTIKVGTQNNVFIFEYYLSKDLI